MDTVLDIRMALGSDLIGMALVVVMIVGNIWRLRLKSKESKLLIAMLLTSFSCCFFDVVAFAVDGISSDYAENIVYLTNTALFASNFLCAYSWFLFLKEHLKLDLSNSQQTILRITKVLLLVLLIFNIYCPFIFYVDEMNRYNRMFGYWIYVAFNYALIINSLILYYKNYRQDSSIRFFPIWLYIIPIVSATVIQSLFYGISLMAASFAVAIAGAFTSLQNERIFRDDLTGLFNRSFLDYVLTLYSQKGRKASGIMISLCNFEEVNEKFGHGVGDQALTKAAELIHDSVGGWGSVLRYSGDEFIVMMDSQYDDYISNCILKIQTNFDKFNREHTEAYTLTPAIGFKKHNSKADNVDKFLDGLVLSTKQEKMKIKEGLV